MKNAIVIFIFTVLVTLFYRHVGQLVPQKEVPAPEKVAVGDEISTEEMVSVGDKLVQAKCMSCHAIQPRFPALEGIGAVAGSRIDGYSDVEYLAEALYDPDAFIVESFSKGMTAANKPPLNLSDKEILTVIAYLQSLGGTPSVTMKTKLKYQSEDGGAAPAQAAAPAAKKVALTGEQVFTNYACGACHSVTSATPLVGPTLWDIGKRMNIAELYEAIMDPDATIAEGYAPGMMGATLVGSGFYDLSATEVKALVDYLATLKGEG